MPTVVPVPPMMLRSPTATVTLPEITPLLVRPDRLPPMAMPKLGPLTVPLLISVIPPVSPLLLMPVWVAVMVPLLTRVVLLPVMDTPTSTLVMVPVLVTVPVPDGSTAVCDTAPLIGTFSRAL